jgi:predicted lysophospholipase L1 biosynthesis ABC-type transport system permease subunit
MGVQIGLTLALKIPNVLTVALTATLGYIGQRIGDPEEHRRAELPPMPLLVAVCASYTVCALIIAVLPQASVLALAPLALLTIGVVLDSRTERAWHAA